MLADLQHLIQLQELDTALNRCRHRIAEIPAAQQALESRAAARASAVQAVKDRIAATANTRREVEKEAAAVQTRLSKYKDQLMAVKTNKEYQAMQTEIATAEQLVRSQDDRLLELMEVSEQEAGDLKTAEAALKADQGEIAKERQRLEEEKARQESELQRLAGERASVAAQLTRDAQSLYDRVAHSRKGQALAEARGGLCSVCHVRIRPQIFNTVRRNEQLLQCDSCGRILYFVPVPQPQPPQP